MSNFPTVIDGAASLFSPVDAFSASPLETTATNPINAGDSTISVASTALGFAATYGILSIDDELIVYASKTTGQFTGCQRGAFGTTAAGHANGVTIRANMVAGFLTALQSAVLAIENELGTAAARNYVPKTGAVTITGLKTFTDGAEFGSGTKAGSGLLRLPNAGAMKWRKADDSGDLGIALNSSNHLAMDAIVDFAVGQTFGAFAYPDATISSKGIVSIDPAGGLAVAAGAVSLDNSGAAAGTYSKVTVDAKGRVTVGANIASGDLPSHTHVSTDIVSGSMPFAVQSEGSAIGTRHALNLIAGARTTLSVTDDSPNDRVNVIVGGTALVATEVTDALGYTPRDLWCGYQSTAAVLENLAKFSEDFTNAVWDKNGASCSAAANSVTAPDGSVTADTITAVTATPIIQQQVAGLADGGTYTFYIWARIASGTRQVSLAIVNNAYGAYLAGPTQVTLTTSWRRFTVTGMLAGGQTGLWVVVRQYDANGDDWTSGNIYLWGACLQNTVSVATYVHTLATQIATVKAGHAAGATVITQAVAGEVPLRIYGAGSNLADKLLFAVNESGEVTIAGGTGAGYMFSELMAASSPSGWSGVLKVKTPSGSTLGHILLYTNP